MTKQKFGLILFIFALLWTFGWGIVGSFICNADMHAAATMDELNQTVWSFEGPLFFTWGILGAPLGVILALIGMFLYVDIKGLKAWLSGLGIVLGVAIGLFVANLGHVPILFGIGGTLILLFFFGVLWFWAKERKELIDARACAADLKLVGFVFLVIAAWFTCGGLSFPMLKAMKGLSMPTPIHIMIYTVLGWLFLFWGYYKAGKK